MKKTLTMVMVAAIAMPSLVLAQGDKNAEVRLAKLEEIVVTADKHQPANYVVDAKTAALLAEIEKAK